MNKIQWLLIDLDETLYPPEAGLWHAIAARISQFMEQYLQIPQSEVQRLREHYFKDYGTTLNGLIVHHNVDPMEYMEFVHDIPVERYLSVDHGLQEMLSQLPQRKAIFTNADHNHVMRVTRALGVETHFTATIDLPALNWVNKPQLHAYQKALELIGVDNPTTVMMLDDQVRNLLPAKQLGMITVLVGKHTPNSDVDYSIPAIIDLLPRIPELLEVSKGDTNEC